MSCEEVGVSPLQLRIAAMALLRHGPHMPSQRREELMQVVMTYYGGREISDEDLEKALVVGMSPHERRRFEKKRGYTFKHLTKSNNLIDAGENNIGCKPAVSVQNASNSETKDSLLLNAEQEYADRLTAEVSTKHSSWNTREKSAPVSGEADDVASDIINMSLSDNDETSGSGDFSNDQLEGKDVLQKRESRMSLLGHGPHGKQVVEYLLKEQGDDGIREFCQRWRLVFVEALHPRFLPAGWDVKHSGKRDFGDFSVYKPTKNDVAAAAAR